MKLGYSGSAKLKENMIRRMKKHIDSDTLIRENEYLDYSALVGGKGCSIICLTIDYITEDYVDDSNTMRYGESQGFLRGLASKADAQLNIAALTMFIDIYHELTPLSYDFNLELLDKIQLDVDYTGFVKAYRIDLGINNKLPMGDYGKIRTWYHCKLTEDRLGSSCLAYTMLFRFMDAWNITHRIKETQSV